MPRPKRRSAAVWRCCRRAIGCASICSKGTANILITDEELKRRRAELQNNGGYPIPKHQTPWQEIQRGMVDQLDEGMVLKPAVKYQRVAQTSGIPRDNRRCAATATRLPLVGIRPRIVLPVAAGVDKSAGS